MRLMLLICPLVFPDADFLSTDCRGAGCVVTTPSKARVFGVVVVGIIIGGVVSVGVDGDVVPFKVVDVIVSIVPFVVDIIVVVVIIVLVPWLPFCKLNLVLFFGDCLFVCLRQGGRGGTISSPEYDVVGEVVIVVIADVIVISGRGQGCPFYLRREAL